MTRRIRRIKCALRIIGILAALLALGALGVLENSYTVPLQSLVLIAIGVTVTALCMKINSWIDRELRSKRVCSRRPSDGALDQIKFSLDRAE